MSKSRRNITPEVQAVLVEYYERGMSSKGKQHEALQAEVAKKTGLPIEAIQNWIGNYKKKVQGKKYVYPKSSYCRGMTSYNCFVHENKEELESMKDWANQWNTLIPATKEEYKQKAKQQKTEGQVKPNVFLKKIWQLISDLKDVGYDMVCLGVDTKTGKQVTIGDGKAASFFHTRPSVCQDFFASFALDIPIPPKKVALDELRKKAQHHMNELYAKATGRKGSTFPYQSVQTGNISVEGLPREVQPLRVMSHYGEEKLKLIMGVETITVTRRETQEPVPSTSSMANRERQKPVPPTATVTVGSMQTEDSQDTVTSKPNVTSQEKKVGAEEERPTDPTSVLQHLSEGAVGTVEGLTDDMSRQSMLMEVDPSLENELQTLIDSKVLINQGIAMEDLLTAKEGLKKEENVKGPKRTKKGDGKSRSKRAKTTTKLDIKTLPGEYEVEEVLGVNRRQNGTFFHIKWKGFAVDEATWEPETNIPPNIIADFYKTLGC